MKKFLFATLFLAGLAFLTPSADAGRTQRVFVGYDRCGNPVYREVYVSSQYYRPAYSYAPVRSYSYGRSYDRYDRYDRGHCSSSRRSSSRPRVAISFGF